MGKIILKVMGVLIFFLFVHSPVFAEFEWFHTYDYDTAKRFYLHPIVNYDFSIHWYDLAERMQFSQTQFQMNIGSVSLNQLNTEIHYSLNKRLNRYVWFRVRYQKEQKQELPLHSNDALLAFDFAINETFSFFIAANPDFDKSRVNAHVGLMISNSQKNENYLRLSLERPQFVYDFKNEWEGKTTQIPYKINWTSRFQYEPLHFYTEGYWERPFKRIYPQNESNSLRYHQLENNYFAIKMYHNISDNWLMQYGISYRKFVEKQNHEHVDLSYKKRFAEMDLRSEYNLERFVIRPEFRYLYHFSKRTIQTTEDHERQKCNRDEFLYALFGGKRFAAHQIEIGYLATQFWVEKSPVVKVKKSYREQKALLGWSYHFSEHTILRITVSHVFTIHGFGGGNMQFITHF